MVEILPEACARLVCKMKRKKAKLILEPVEGCTCSRSLSRIPKMESEGRAVEFDAFYDTDAKAAGKCWFNRRWSVNSVVAILEDHCVEIACVYDEVAARAVLQARFLPGCECGGGWAFLWLVSLWIVLVIFSFLFFSSHFLVKKMNFHYSIFSSKISNNPPQNVQPH